MSGKIDKRLNSSTTFTCSVISLSRLARLRCDRYPFSMEQRIIARDREVVHHAKEELARYTGLFKEEAAPETQVDHWRYERDSAAAALLAAQAQVELAKLNLGYTQVKAPFDGRIGRHLVDPGNVVGAAGVRTSLADIERIDPLYVYFTVNERDLLRVIEHRKQTSAPPIAERRIPVFFGLSNEEGYPHGGAAAPKR